MDEIKTQTTEVTDEISLTPKAVNEVKKIKSENNISDEFALRVGVKGGGCSGFTYTLGFDSDIKDTDRKFEFDGVLVVVDWKSILYLKGTTIDFSDGLMGKGFVFNNPMAKRTCGCGSSFGV
ncbi:MAG: iron-sulfur cluster assembly accessory protein [Ignavibacteria bacterium]|nr:iron-sulfur cluster assembly accessory protein [Ignavibacteria bacterium]